MVQAFEKDSLPKAEHDSINVEETTRTVNNDSFTYEFEESLKAYNTKLYLAASATAGNLLAYFNQAAYRS